MINPEEYAYSKTIRGAATLGPVDGLPLLITGEWLKANIPEFFPNCLEGGGDIRVCMNSDGTSQCAVEVAKCSVQDEDARIYFLPASSYSEDNRDFTIFWGKSGATQPDADAIFGRNSCNSNSYLTLRFEEEMAPIQDSTGKSLISIDGVVALGEPTGSGSGISTGGDLDGGPTASGVMHPSSYSIFFHIESGTMAGNWQSIYRRGGNPNIVRQNNTDDLRIVHDGVAAILPGGYAHLISSAPCSCELHYDEYSLSLFVNDEYFGSVGHDSFISSPESPMSAEIFHEGDKAFDGLMGEIEVVDATSSPYSALRYANQYNNLAFWSLAPEVSPVIEVAGVTDVRLGGAILITGSGFVDIDAVTINEVPVDSYTVLSDTQISAQVPSTVEAEIGAEVLVAVEGVAISATLLSDEGTVSATLGTPDQTAYIYNEFPDVGLGDCIICPDSVDGFSIEVSSDWNISIDGSAPPGDYIINFDILEAESSIRPYDRITGFSFTLRVPEVQTMPESGDIYSAVHIYISKNGPDNQPINLVRGDTKRISIACRGLVGVADVSNWDSFTLSIGSEEIPTSAGTEIYKEVGAFNTDGQDGIICFPPASSMDAGTYYYDIQAVDSNMEKVTIAKGLVPIIQDINKD